MCCLVRMFFYYFYLFIIMKYTFLILFFLVSFSSFAVEIVLNVNNNNPDGSLYIHPTTARPGDVIVFRNNLNLTLTTSQQNSTNLIFSPQLPGMPASIAVNSFWRYNVTSESPNEITFIFMDMNRNAYYNSRVRIEKPSSVENVSSLNRVYPNPANEYVIIEAQGQVKMFDSCGKVVSSFTTVSEKTRLNLTNLNTGIYFIQVNGADAVRLLKR